MLTSAGFVSYRHLPMATTIPKYGFPRCRFLRENAGESMSRLAGLAVVGRDLVRSLEQGNSHSRHKVMSVFNALQKLHADSLRAEDELVPFPESEDDAMEE